MQERGSTFFTEFRAGTATFMTMCYILAVNSRLLADSGGPCECGEALKDVPDCVFFDPEYLGCVEIFRRQLVTVTALSAFIACFLMGITANLPFALAPGMGLNAYFTYDVVGFHGTGRIKWKIAMAAVFLEGIVFIILTLTGLRIRFAKAIPNCIKVATTGGIGFFLAHLGLQTAEGIGLVVTDVATGLTLGGCSPAYRTYARAPTCLNPEPSSHPRPYIPNCRLNPEPSSNTRSYTLNRGVYGVGHVSARNAGGHLTTLHTTRCLTILHATSQYYTLPHVYSSPAIPDGHVGIDQGRPKPYRTLASMARSKTLTENPEILAGEVFVALFTFLYVDLLDTTAASFFIILSSLEMSDPNVNEPSCGRRNGGRTGLTAIVVSLYFLISIFFAPLLASVPPWATGPALIIIGAMMMRRLVDINWDDFGEAIPAFITIALMPLTYSIAYGILGGLLTWTFMHLLHPNRLPTLTPKPPPRTPHPKTHPPNPTPGGPEVLVPET
ncbi:hypothetical protein T484DRAFT_1616624 [Baffinella frigidus]|nr:hypothetical protein T484DRAFT_1616624 [Cryptophyta sp. CCMP2293]